ncbi:uncharacterized protein LOC116734435 [Xiphophorus hellerii]|uniref:uncharacterized protein LOC116734435 n=1 Tax=Xiphophorus hellerii TaxID=8084 RepID=UPI0013B43F30|nr:uncharacterized protein LOC116734435 [Xiphophorus hellerii]
MTCTKITGLLLSLLLLLLLGQVCSQGPEIVFREEGGNVVMGYCFGADYLLAYRSAAGGEQLLGNSSNKNLPNTPPVDLEGRIQMNEVDNLLGIQIDELTDLDSGIYRRECWQNHTMVNNHMEQLFVCKEEISAEEIKVNSEGGADIRCQSSSVGQEGTFVRWYLELQPDYKPILLLDSSVSLEPVMKELQDSVEARENGAVLMVNKIVFQNFPQFHCTVFKGKTCLGFQNLFLPDYSYSKEVYVSKGERVVLNCSGDGGNLWWETPQGQLNSSSPRNNEMYISAGEEPDSFSLIIPVISDEHKGTYTCIAPTFEIEYSLFLCPKSELQEKVYFKDSNISLECTSDLDNLKRVQWFRHVQADIYEIIGDTYDELVSIPEDLEGRVELSISGLLNISNLCSEDERMYRCIVLKEFQDNVTAEENDYEEGTNEDYFNEDEHTDADRCFFKQEFILKSASVRRIIPRTFPTTAPTNDSGSHVVYAVVVGLVFLVIAAVVIVMVKKRPSVFAKNRNREKVTAVDSDCTDSLKQNAEDKV